jgi:uncharacterized protein YbgA (DUF1722 family)
MEHFPLLPVEEEGRLNDPKLWENFIERIFTLKRQRLLLEALSLKTTPKKNANVLQHILGYFKEQLSGDEKKELLEIIDQYRQLLIPLIVPVTLVDHYVRKYDQPYLQDQYYLHPHPVELQLRNHV